MSDDGMILQKRAHSQRYLDNRAPVCDFSDRKVDAFDTSRRTKQGSQELGLRIQLVSTCGVNCSEHTVVISEPRDRIPVPRVTDDRHRNEVEHPVNATDHRVRVCATLHSLALT
jgi:hypothetical protein